MKCSISGVTPTNPVVSTKSGHIFERRLIEKHIKVTGTCPVTKEELSDSDLLDVQTSEPTVRPRPPSATSIPGMLQKFQDEWDSLALETYTLKEHLDTVRQELAHALYQHDAACRVIARLMKERDDARRQLGMTQDNVAQALKKTPAGAAAGVAAMEVEDGEGISPAVVKKMSKKASALAKGRKKHVKALVQAVAKKDAVKEYTNVSSHPLHSAAKAGITCLDIHPTKQDLIMTGGMDGNAIVFNRGTGKIMDTLKKHKKAVTDVLFHPTEDLAFTTSMDHTANIWNMQANGKYSASQQLRAHSAAVVGCTLHPSGSYLVTASADHTWAFFDVTTGVCRKQVKNSKVTAGYSCVTFHPDGLILGAGTEDSMVRIFEIKAQKIAATFKGHNGKVTSLSFSQNGYYLASGDDHGVVKLWDLRKLENFENLQSEKMKSIKHLSFDASGAYLSVASDAGLRVYSSSRGWDVVQKWEDTSKYHKKEVTCAKFGANSSFLGSTSMDRTLKFWGPK